MHNVLGFKGPVPASSDETFVKGFAHGSLGSLSCSGLAGTVYFILVECAVHGSTSSFVQFHSERNRWVSTFCVISALEEGNSNKREENGVYLLRHLFSFLP